MDAVLLSDIKYNCNISDAQFWGYFSVCGLLMRYRDLYRSERGLKPWSEIDRIDIMSWIADKEAKWPDLEQRGFRDLVINGKSYGPFDVVKINQALSEHQLVYGAGYGMYMKPTFFLAELRSLRTISGLSVYTSGEELVRDLFTAPGMLQETTIFLRREPLVMLLLYKFSELNTRRITALEDAFAQYGFKQRQLLDDTFEQRIEAMAERYADILLLHEVAEYHEEAAEWKDILVRSEDRKVELYLRAIKDLMADTSDHGPYKKIVDTRDRGALSLTVALMEGFRRTLFPGIRDAYQEFMLREDWAIIENARCAGYERFRSLRDRIVALYGTSEGKDEFNRMIKEMFAA